MTYITSGGATVAAMEYFGDGVADVVWAANASLASPQIFHNLTINAGVVITGAGYPIMVSGTLTLGAGAIIKVNGGDTATFAAGAGAGAAIFGGGSAGGVGNTFGGSPGLDIDVSAGAAGGAGGGPGGGPGAAGVVTPIVNNGKYLLHALPLAASGMCWKGTATTKFNGGSGGGGGGADFTYKGGGGGGGAGVMVVLAKNIVWGSGAKMQANGGHGGDGQVGGLSGGGGGGGGGYFALVYRSVTGALAVEALGGIHGNGSGRANGDDGTPGTTVILPV